MADHQEDEDLKLALKMSMQSNPPEPKRSKPIEEAGSAAAPSDETPEAKSRRLQRELMAAAAERRIMMLPKIPPPQAQAQAQAKPPRDVPGPVTICKEAGSGDGSSSGKELSPEKADQLFRMVFGNEVSKSILSQWTNQGIRFSSDPETTIGLVQHEGGPCGVLAALQAYVLKYLIYFPDDIGKASPSMGVRRFSKDHYVASDSFSSVPEEAKTSALVRSMCEILFMCGANNRAVIASFPDFEGSNTNKNEAMAGELPIGSASDLQKILRFETFTTQASALNKLQGTIGAFQSRMGALGFLISALLSRGLDSIQTDRDDPNLPLVTAPFGHASQEIVNLLLCGEAVPNVFDGRMDLGGGMFLKGISKNVEVGFLTLLESLNFCKVGQALKCPRWPIWVIGSESHYTVLFATDPSVQEENELELRESQIRRAFDARDESGGGGFISVDAFRQVVQETNIRLPTEKLNEICATGFIVWSELWQVMLELDRSLGGIKDSTGMMGKKVFDIYHFNGIAKSDLNGGGQAMAVEGGSTVVPMQRPRLTKLRVSVPPKWTPEEYMSTALPSSSSEKGSEVNQPGPAQHAPLVDCIRTRWPRATCSWGGDAPSIV